MLTKHFASAAVAALMSFAALPAVAAVVVVPVNSDVSDAPFTYDFGAGGTLTFDENTSGFASVIGVQTSGSAQVFGVFGTPSLFQPFATTSFPSQQLGSFASYATSTAVPFSLSSGSIGFKFTLDDGDHFGIAKISGSRVGALYIQDHAGADISLAVPEPATWAMMLLGFGGLGAALRRARRRDLVIA